MAKLGIFTGTSPNDTTGDTLSQGAVKINSNFSEIYSAIGDGTNITNSLSSITVAGLSTFTNGPVVIGSGIQTGTSKLQVSGNTFITGSVGVGTTNPGEKLQVDGNIRVGISTTSNYIAFRGTYNDDQTTYLNTFIGERIYDYSGVNAERSELLLFKGNDVAADSGVGPDRIRLAAGEFRFDTYSTIGGVLPGYASPLSFESAATLENITNKMILTGTGNLGIGTTNPKAALDVGIGSVYVSNGDIHINGSPFIFNTRDAFGGFFTNGGTDGLGFLNILSPGGITGFNVKLPSGSAGSFGAPDTADMYNTLSTRHDGTQGITDFKGLVGIGTTSPTESLHVVGNVKVTGTITGSFSSTVATATTATNVSGGIGSVTQLQVTGLSTFTNGPVLVGRATTTGTANQALQVGSATTALGAYISGNLGIGTTNPGEKLQVDGNIRVGISTTSNYIAFRGTLDDDQTTYTHTYIGERIYESGTERSELLLFKGNDNYTAGGPGPDRIRLAAAEFRFDTIVSPATVSGTFEEVATSANITNKMILTGTGNLGIGTTNPTSSLSVNGSTVIGTEILDMTGLSSTFTTVGSNTFTVPAGVTKISAVLIGGGGAGGGGSNAGGGNGGGGGGLRYVNDFPVTPGQTLTVIVGAGGNGGTGVGGNGGNGENSSITGIATAFGGTGGTTNYQQSVSVGGAGTGGSGGATGGSGGKASLNSGGGGGGGAGYSGNGGDGADAPAGDGNAGSGGGAGGGGAPKESGSGGGGVGILGQGTSGSSSNGAGNAGSGGSNGLLGSTLNGADGGLYGGGGGGGDGGSGSVSGGNGGQGAVRIIFSPQSKFSRLFPTNQVGNNINQ